MEGPEIGETVPQLNKFFKGVFLGHSLPLLSDAAPILTLLSLLLLLLAAALVQIHVDRAPASALTAWARLRRTSIRRIVYVSSNDYVFRLLQDHCNEQLQRAVFFYLAAYGQQHASKFQDGDVILIPRLGEAAAGGSKATSSEADSDSSSDWGGWVAGTLTSAKLRTLRLAIVPAKNTWQLIEDGLFLRYEVNSVQGVRVWEERKEHTLTLLALGRRGQSRINDFVQRCYDYYMNALQQEEDSSRYFFQLQQSGGFRGPSELLLEPGNSVNRPLLYKKYKLNDDKTFDSVFFKEKEAVLKLVHDFQTKGGKYAVEGFPHKLGILLHGPPGTGKTSFVKALAHFTKRHIIAIPLSKLSTNQELYDIVFQKHFPCDGDTRASAPQYSFYDVMFLMEDIDAASEIVHRRATPTPAAELPALETQSEVHRNGESEELIAEGVLKVERFRPAPSHRGIATSLLGTYADKLDLAGLLNVLDGVVDTPGRVVVMTSNHPDKLDPALIRPGRINLALRMTFMELPQLEQMLKHHFLLPPAATLPTAETQQLHEIFEQKSKEAEDGKFCLTPAEAEQLCCMSETIEEFLEALRHFPESLLLPVPLLARCQHPR